MMENIKFMGDSANLLSNTMRLPNDVFSTSEYSAMDNRKEFIERRKHHRFKVKRGAVAAMIKTSSENEEQAPDMPMNEGSIATIQMGQIINISKGGLVYCYIDGEDEYNKLFDLDILFVQDGFYLKKVPANTVWVSQAVRKPSSNLLKSKQQGLQFEELTPHQISQLDFFLQNYTLK
ncbi:MAG TPA: PilZ domain-containing protein [Desulfobacterales bacterium]|nr:PilZ domain-containing protein [Desulfobacterales bacterium]